MILCPNIKILIHWDLCVIYYVIALSDVKNELDESHMKHTALNFLTSVLALFTLAFSTAFADENKGISYGPLDRQKYDLYFPKNVSDDTPVLFFIYGGGWTSGKREKYGFVGGTFVREGYITAIPDYRLHPEVVFPAFVEDVALAFSAVKERFPSRKIFIAGHSAGAQIGSLLTLDQRYLDKHGVSSCSDVAGFIGLAGPYDFLPLREQTFKNIFPEPTRAESQAINFANAKTPPVMLLHGSFDTLVHDEDSKILGEKLRSNGNDATVKIYNGVGHIVIMSALSPVLDIAAPTRRDMIDFMKSKYNSAHSCE